MKDHVRSRWQRVVLVCRKCRKRAGQHGKARLAKALQRRLGHGKGRKADAGVVEVGCLDVCPKGGIVIVDTERPRDWLIVPADAHVETVVARLSRPAAPPLP